MKKIRCPKCDEPILFDDSRYEAGRTLVFECPECHKQFRLRIPGTKAPADAEQEEERQVYGRLVIIENAFHLKQQIPLYEGENVVGRHVKGTKANAAFKTVDPSVDTTHCIVTVKPTADGQRARFILRDAPSNTGTFLFNDILPDRARVDVHDGDIITIGATTMILREGQDDEEE